MRKVRPMFTVAIPTFDRGNRAFEAVRGALAGDTPFELFELLVLDNASTAGIESYQAISQISDPRLRYIRRDETQSYQEQILQLLEEANGEYLLFMSDEDQLCLPALIRLQEHLREHHESVLYLEENDSFINKHAENGFFNCYYLSSFVADISNKQRTQEVLRMIPRGKTSLQSYIYPHKLVAFLIQILSDAPVEFTGERFCLSGLQEKLSQKRAEKLRDIVDPGSMPYRQVQSRIEQLLDWLKLFERYERLISHRYPVNKSSRLLNDALIDGMAITAAAVLFEPEPLIQIKKLAENMSPVLARAKILAEQYEAFSAIDLVQVEQKLLCQVRYIQNHIERLLSRLPKMLSSLHADGRRLVVYGAGYMGRALYQYRHLLDREIFCFCDQQGLAREPSSDPYRAIRPTDLAELREPMDIVIAVTSGLIAKSIRADLRAVGITQSVITPFLPFQRVVITGATGMLGNALINYCIQQEVEILALVRSDSPRISELPDSPMLKIVSCPLEALCKYTGDGRKYDVFFHLGWSRTDRDGRNDPALQNENEDFTLDALRLAKRLGCECFIGAGSQAEYGPVEGIITEQTPTAPVTAYGKVKLRAGIKSRKLAKQLGIRCCWSRIFSIYGPLDHPDTMIAETIVHLLAGKPTFFTQLTQYWNYLYVSDAAVALYNLAEYGQDGEVYNVAGEETRLLRENVEALFAEMGKEVHGVGALPFPNGKVVSLCPDIRKIQRDTGFIQKTSFSEGIGKTIRWYRERFAIRKEEG